MRNSTAAVRHEIVPPPVQAPPVIRVCHIMSADLWAGAEVQVATTAAYLVNEPGVSLCAVLLNEGRLASELRRLGVRVTVVDETRTSALGIVAFLIELLREQRIDLVHTHRYKDTVLGCIAARIAGVPYAVRTIHGLREPMTGWARIRFAVYEALENAVMRRVANRMIAVSNQIAGVLRDTGYPDARVTRIHNGVDLRLLRSLRHPADVRRDLGIPQGAVLIGTVGRLTPVKGHASFLRAARMVLQQQPAATFLIVGDGPLRGRLQAMAVDLGIDDKCLFLGHRADVHDLVSAMDVFVLPSLSEGIPMAILEAMALGKPIVATAVGGVPEVVSHRETGLLVPAGDEQALANACTALAFEPGLAERLGVRARRSVEKTFSHTRSGETLARLYREVVRVGDDGVTPPRSTRPGGSPLVLRFVRGLLGRANRRVACAMGRHRMNRVRRNAAALALAAGTARHLLIVCHGNIIRSPFAEHVIRRSLGQRSVPVVSSAGLQALPGGPPHPTALLAGDHPSHRHQRSFRIAHFARPRGGERSDPGHGCPAAGCPAAALSRGGREDIPVHLPRARCST